MRVQPVTPSSILRFMADLIMPVDCALCGQPRYALCPACAGSLASRPPSVRSLPGLRAPLVLATSEHGQIVTLLSRLKDSGQTELARPLGMLLARCLAEAVIGFTPGCILVTAPNARNSFVARGFYPVPLMLRRAGLRAERILVSATGTVDQRGLTHAERQRNLRNSLVADPRIHGLPVVLVEDVVTTGATVIECVRALTEAGAHVVGVVALAAVPRKFPQSGFNA